MGANCSCFRDPAPAEKDIIADFSRDAYNIEQLSSAPPENLLKLQSALRSFLCRKTVESQLARPKHSEFYSKLLPAAKEQILSDELKLNQQVLFKEHFQPITVEKSARYRGELNNEKQRCGFGIQEWPDGARYEGYWAQDQASGKGRLIHADGNLYEGDWVDNKANGNGKYLHQDGTLYTGEWTDDKQHGHGAELWPDGAHFTGEYAHGQKQGAGRFE